MFSKPTGRMKSESNIPEANLGCKSFTEFTIHSLSFGSFLEHTLMDFALKNNDKNQA